LIKEFLIQRRRGKNGIKNYRDDYHEFREFWWKFHNFWIKESIKINWGKKIRSIWRLGLIKGFSWVQLGAEELSGCKLGLLNIEGT
jgi:hypothetical protein